MTPRRARVRSGAAVWSDGQRRLVKAIVAVIFAVAIAFAIRASLRYYLFFSGEFVVRNLDVESGETFTPELLRDFLGLREGMPLFDPTQPLFAADLSAKQRNLMKAAYSLATLSITRRLPDTIIVRATERTPLYRLSSRDLAIDSEGVVFPRYRGLENLPRLTGYSGAMAVSGARAEGMLVAAIEFAEMFESLETSLRLRAVDVAKPDCIECTFADGRKVTIAWKHMCERNDASRRFLEAQFRGVYAAMNSSQGAKLKTFNAIIPGRAYGK